MHNIDGFEFGHRRSDIKATGRGVIIDSTAIDKGNVTTQDVAVSGLDGRMMGRDYLPGMSITFTGTCISKGDPDDATQLYGDLEAAWQNPEVRATPGMYSELRMTYPYTNREVLVYGRGRQIAPTLGDVRSGLVGWTGQFDCVDNTFYAADEETFTVKLQPVDTGGFIPPFIPPILLAGTVQEDFTIINAGARTYPIFEISGPVTNPTIMYPEIGTRIMLEMSVPAGVTITLDCRPWKMTVLDQGGGSYAGKIKGGLLEDLSFARGPTLVAYIGQDLTGTSRLVCRWRRASPMLGGN